MEQQTTPLVLTFRHQKKEYIAAHRSYLFYSKTIRKSTVILLPILLAAILIRSFYAGLDAMSMAALAALLFAAVSGICLYAVVPVKVFQNGTKYQEEYTLTLSPEGIHFQTATVDSMLKWNLYTQALENEDHFYLAYQRGQFTLLPKRAFSGEEEKARFRALVQNGVGPIKQV